MRNRFPAPIELYTPGGFERFFKDLGDRLRRGPVGLEELNRLGQPHGIRFFDDWTTSRRPTTCASSASSALRARNEEEPPMTIPVSVPFARRRLVLSLKRARATPDRPRLVVDSPAADGATDADLARINERTAAEDRARWEVMAILHGLR